MNQCPKCSNKLSDIDVLCPKCGAFVEIVQSGNGSTPPSAQTISDDLAALSESIAAVQSRPELILYNEDLPPEAMLDEDFNLPDSFTAISPEPPEPPAKTDKPASQSESMDNALSALIEDYNKSDEQPGDMDTADETDAPDDIDSPEDVVPTKIINTSDDKASADETIVQTKDDDTPNDNQQDEAFVDESIYSESYLHTLKQMQLPEVDNLSEFDPDEFMREYQQAKSAPTFVMDTDTLDIAAIPLPEKHWLELEEVDAAPEPMAEVPVSNQTDSDDYTLYRSSNFEDSLSSPQKEPRKKHATFLAVLIWLVVTTAVFFGFFTLNNYVIDKYGNYSNMMNEITRGHIVLDTVASYKETTTVEVSSTKTEDGQSAHLFDIHAAAGNQVTLLPLGETFALTDGQAQLVVSDEVLFKSLDDTTYDSLYETDAIAFDVTTDKSPYTYQVDTLTLTIAQTPFVRSQPTQSFLSTSDTSILIEITVAPNTRVSINGTDYSDDVEDGTLSVWHALVLGENKFSIEAERYGMTVTTDTFTVTRQVAHTQLAPDTDYLRVYAESFTCVGSTDPGAEVTALLDDKDVYTALVDSAGAYTLACTIADYGLHAIMLTADSVDLAQAKTDVRVEYIPEISEFTLTARALALNKVSRYADALIITSGILSEPETNAHTRRFTITDGKYTLPCYYYGTSLLETDKEYTIYGTFDELTDSFYAMYIL